MREWSRSPEFRRIALEALERVNATRHLRPKCGAVAKSTGQPCRREPAPGRTRCKFHGGWTPRGDGPFGWHTPAFWGGIPTGKPRSDEMKRNRRRKRDEEIAARTPEQLERYERHRRSHEPGSKAQRARRKQDRAAAEWLRELLAAKSQDNPSAAGGASTHRLPSIFD